MRKLIDLSGKVIGRLKVIERVPDKPVVPYWRCVCSCGNEVEVQGSNLRSGHTKSCGCLNNEKLSKRRYKHGLSYEKHYVTWKNMIKRCYDHKNEYFSCYGGRGILVCDNWKNDPKQFIDWVESQKPIPDTYSLDRVNNDGNYCPENCRFTSKQVQSENRRPRRKLYD